MMAFFLFTLLVPNCPITFMEHKRCVVHIARDSALAMQAFMGRALPIDLDTVIAGAILADVGKLLEYEIGLDGWRSSVSSHSPRKRRVDEPHQQVSNRASEHQLHAT